MTHISIFCADDAETLAKQIAGKITNHDVRVDVCALPFGDAGKRARERGDIVVLIWSENGKYAQNVRDWTIDPPFERMIEIATIRSYPQLPGRPQHPIELFPSEGRFTRQSWTTFADRLHLAVASNLPRVPQPNAAAGIVFATGAAAAVAAFGVRGMDHALEGQPNLIDGARQAIAQTAQSTTIIQVASNAAQEMGGAEFLDVIEPDSMDGVQFARLGPRIRPLDTAAIDLDTTAGILPSYEYRDPNVFTRIAESVSQTLSSVDD